MKTPKLLGIIVGGCVAAAAAALGAVWLLVNPNDYKPRIVAAVRQATGRELQLHGDLKLAVFPWVALRLGPATLGNPPGFSAERFISLSSASIRVKLWPLLGRRLEFGRIELDGLEVTLLRNAAGVGNWEGFGAKEAGGADGSGVAGAPGATSATSPTGASEASGERGATFAGLAGIRITNARVVYDNYVLEHASLETGAFTEQGLTPLSLHAEASRGVVGEALVVDANLDARMDSARGRYALEAMHVVANLRRPTVERAVRVALTAPSAALDWGAHTLSVPSFGVDAAGATLSGAIEGAHLDDAATLAGNVQLAPVVVREYLERVGLGVPATRDARALSSASAAIRFAYAGGVWRLTDLQATLDDTHVQGSAEWSARSAAFALTADGLDVDRYLPPATAPARATLKAPEPSVDSAAAEEAPARAIQGTLAIAVLHVAPFNATHVQATLARENGVTRLHPLTAEVDGGTYAGDVTLQTQGGTTVLSMQHELSGIDLARLPASASRSIRLTGRGNVSLQASGRGTDSQTLLRTMNGRVEAYVTGGAVEGIDLGFQLARAEALLDRGSSGSARDSGRTPFDAFKMSAQVTDGVAVSKDLTIASPVLKVTGQGSADLPAQTLNFALTLDTLRSIAGTPLQVPLTVSGPMASPEVRPDLEALMKGALKQKLQDVLQDKLKGLFGK